MTMIELTGARLLDLTHNVCHSSLVANEGSEVAGLLWVIPREGLHCRKKNGNKHIRYIYDGLVCPFTELHKCRVLH